MLELMEFSALDDIGQLAGTLNPGDVLQLEGKSEDKVNISLVEVMNKLGFFNSTKYSNENGLSQSTIPLET